MPWPRNMQAALYYARKRQRERARQFSAYEMFAKYGAEGFLLDNFNPATRISGLALLYEESTGQTAVAAASDPVGMALDRSQGVAIGPELVTNGGFDADSDWGKATGWTISGGEAVKSPGAATSLTQNIGAIEGSLYEVRLTVTRNAGFAFVRVGSLSDNSTPISTAGTNAYRFIIRCGSDSSTLYVFGDANFDASIDDISVKKISGNHATQATGAARPTLRQDGSGRWLLRGDGIDDNLLSALKPAASMTLIAVGTPDSGSVGDVIMGSQPASDGRAYLALDGSGYLAGGVGTQGTGTIVDGNSLDIQGTRCGMAIRWDGSTVDLFLNTGLGLTNVYSAAQSGAADTTIDIMLMGLNNNGTGAAFADADMEAFFAIQAAITDADIDGVINATL